MALKLYPVGIQTFEEIIKRNLLYIDKINFSIFNKQLLSKSKNICNFAPISK